MLMQQRMDFSVTPENCAVMQCRHRCQGKLISNRLIFSLLLNGEIVGKMRFLTFLLMNFIQ